MSRVFLAEEVRFGGGRVQGVPLNPLPRAVEERERNV
jgi:hypothetical protein